MCFDFVSNLEAEIIFFQILTKDSVIVFVNAIICYGVKEPISAVANVDDYSGSLRNVLGTRNLGVIRNDR
jgi:erythrocyte band 7 integral membrane protein